MDTNIWKMYVEAKFDTIWQLPQEKGNSKWCVGFFKQSELSLPNDGLIVYINIGGKGREKYLSTVCDSVEEAIVSSYSQWSQYNSRATITAKTPDNKLITYATDGRWLFTVGNFSFQEEKVQPWWKADDPKKQFGINCKALKEERFDYFKDCYGKAITKVHHLKDYFQIRLEDGSHLEIRNGDNPKFSFTTFKYIPAEWSEGIIRTFKKD